MFDFNLDFLDDIIDNSFKWDKDEYKFNRPVKDMNPYFITDNKTSLTITHNVLGMNKEDLKITRENDNGNDFIKIEGKTIDALTKKEYSISSTFAVNGKELDLDKIASTMKNGLLYITIAKREQPKTASKTVIDIR